MYCNEKFEITSVEWSDDLRHMIGYTDEKDFPNVFDVWADLLHPEDRDCVLDGIAPVLRDTTGNTIFDQDYRLYTKKEGYRWFHVSADVLRREDGTPKCFFGIFIDVTEQKEHDQLEKARDEALKKANDALTAMNVLYEAIGSGAWSNTYDEEGRLIKVEWSDAFRALLGFSSQEDFPDTNEAFLKRVHKDDKKKLMAEYKKALSDTTGKIVYDTQFRAKTKNGTYRWFRTTGRITGTVERTFHGMIIDIDEKKRTDAELVWRDTLADIITREQIKELDMLIRPQTMLHAQDFEIIEEDIIHDNVEGDALRLRQVLANILSNAVKYTQDHGKIRFIISEMPSKSELWAKYKFSVQDNGRGIKQDYLKRIFEPFTRQENSVTNTVQGTGLGMAITKNIVDMMGGIIRVYSKEGQGSTFEVILELRIGKEKTKRNLSQCQEQNVKSVPMEKNS